MSRRLAGVLGIWGLCLGYFLCYIPYSGLTRALTLGLLPGLDRLVPGFVLFPATAVATTVTLLAFVTAGRGWRHLRRRRLWGVSVPVGGGNCWEMKSGPLCAWVRLSGNYNRPRNACSTWRLDSDDVAPRAE
jgi:hypothetical protein